ncbi:HPr kinase/phosphorylase [Thalassovita taeanensis]|uniref:Hpr(Ser) kinase/phosphatase n=1 Tax=Thalassovita taeanensis TaxID=657014 RepID=A0A1H9AZM3_9RHOB|nr:serine kinase [Thalassovita taeanensis]SEP81883.1 Hpr(Ser) kinase/phosphatase [Thalassovita taeanensis]
MRMLRQNHWARALSWACLSDVATGADRLILHASSVALNGRAVVITGASGAGKSALSLQLMAMGAILVADDRTCLWRQGDMLLADAPDTIRGQIEARFVGILGAEAEGPAEVALWVDLDQIEDQRLPEVRHKTVLGVCCPLVHNVQAQHFPAAILQFLKVGRQS